jgi:pilus assembly protein CpaC
MGKRIVFIRHLVYTLCISFGLLLGAQPNLAHADAKDRVFYVPINRSELITTSSNMGEVIITDPEIADVYVHGRNKVSVIGKQIGRTTLRIFDTDNKLLRDVDVVITYDLPAIRRAMHDFLPNEHIGVELVNTRIALTGAVSSAESSRTAMEVAEQFVLGRLTAEEVVTRPVHNAENPSPILNLMKISSGQQVMLRIRIGEIQRTALKNLGVSLQAFNKGSSGFQIGTGAGRAVANAAAGTTGFNFGSFNAAADSFAGIGGSSTTTDGGVSGMVEALERDGLLKILAEPNLTALSGETAEFLAGGEFPIPVPQDGQTITVEYRPFGVALRFTPFVLSDTRIRIQVQPEVSELSNDRTFTTAQGYVAPSLVTRRASTTVELSPGESFMIAGLLRDNISSQINQLPGAGDIPILSALFRSTAFQRNETELVIAVTPYLVDPVKSDQVKFPTDNFRPASFLESIFYGAIGAVDSASHEATSNPSLEGPMGFITD